MNAQTCRMEVMLQVSGETISNSISAVSAAVTVDETDPSTLHQVAILNALDSDAVPALAERAAGMNDDMSGLLTAAESVALLSWQNVLAGAFAVILFGVLWVLNEERLAKAAQSRGRGTRERSDTAFGTERAVQTQGADIERAPHTRTSGIESTATRSDKASSRAAASEKSLGSLVSPLSESHKRIVSDGSSARSDLSVDSSHHSATAFSTGTSATTNGDVAELDPSNASDEIKTLVGVRSGVAKKSSVQSDGAGQENLSGPNRTKLEDATRGRPQPALSKPLRLTDTELGSFEDGSSASFVDQSGADQAAQNSDERPATTVSESGNLRSDDDLTKIKGVGKKTRKLLNQHGVHGFADLARLSTGDIARILDDAGYNSAIVDFESWPAQAAELAGK